MRKEASLESWRELYEITGNIKKLAPWEYLWDTDLIAISLPEREEPIFCSIMGRGGTYYGISAYIGFEGLADFDMIARSEETGLPVDYIMSDQSNLSCYFGSRDELQVEQRKLIKNLELKFRGQGNWLYYESYKKGYTPYLPDEEEVLLLIDIHKNLYMALKAYIEEGCKVDFEHGMCLWRTYSDEEKLWFTGEKPIPAVEKEYPYVELTDEILKRRLKKRPRVKTEIILELSYMNGKVKEEGYDRPINPLLFVAIDASNGMVMGTQLLRPDDDVTGVIVNFVGNYILKVGRMKKIIARIPTILTALEDTCNYCEIELDEEDDRIWMADEFITGLKDMT